MLTSASGTGGDHAWGPRRHRLLLGFTVALSVAGGCERGPAQGEGSSAREVVPVLVARAIQKDVPIQLAAIGTVEPFSTVTIRPQISGQVSKVHFIEGQDIKAGEPLFTIDPRPFEAELRRAEAERAKDEAMARDAAQEAQRQSELLEKNVATPREHDQAQANADAMKATVEGDVAAVETARLRLAYCSIASPITGRAGRRMIDTGNIVRENETAMVVINQIIPVHVAFSVPEQHLSRIKTRMMTEQLAVEVVIPGAEDVREEGVLVFLDNEVHIESGTIRLKARFDNTNRRLWPGQFVSVALTLGSRTNSIVVPSQAVQGGQSGDFVYVVKADQTVEQREVHVVPGAQTEETIIESGLQAGETVVTDGHLRLAPGSAVTIKTGLTPTTTQAQS